MSRSERSAIAASQHLDQTRTKPKARIAVGSFVSWSKKLCSFCGKERRKQ